MNTLLLVGSLITLVVLSWPLGRYMQCALDPVAPGGGRVARWLSKIFGPPSPQGWWPYCKSLLTFNALMFVIAFLIYLAQGHLPLNPDHKGALETSLAFNTAASFMTNTNLQHYSGDQSLSYFTQLFGIGWLQFVSAATGIAALVAIARALGGRSDVGNFYHDLARATFLLLLPLAAVVGLALMACGVPMTFEPAAVAKTLEGAEQLIARGPAAAVVSIKQLGTNGGGYFGPNSAHPLENPTYWTNVLEFMCILLIPMASVWMFGRIARQLRHAAVIFGVMLFVLFLSLAIIVPLESAPSAALAGLPIQDAPNLEGKELRFGPTAGPIWAVATTSTSNGSVNAMLDSLNPLAGLVPMAGLWLNVTFGGVGVGMINMLLFIVVAVFLAGLMVGRTPEYLAKKIGAREITLASIALLMHPFLILVGSGIFAGTDWGRKTVLNPGPHGLSEIVYEFSSAAANNGSGFEGLGDNTVPWNVATGIVMLVARFVPIILPLAIAGLLAKKRAVPETIGTFRTDTTLFAIVLLGVVLIASALLFFPVAVLGPVAEHLSLR